MKLLFLAFNPNGLRGLCDVTSNNLTLKGQPTNAVQGCEMADANSDLKGFYKWDNDWPAKKMSHVLYIAYLRIPIYFL